ncbi:PIG-L family deacetylase [Candidatus Falkowbacteria bacterium]|nr:PIG-L family deacetylase [Candidatus Falkowbacteria bacterium]
MNDQLSKTSNGVSKVLIVAAHADDEVLGMGGTIAKHTKNGDEVRLIVLADGESSRDEPGDIEKREQEAKKAAEILGIENIIFKRFPDQQLDTLPLLKINKAIEEVLAEFKPEIIYTHNPTDLNKDHQLACPATLTACRPQPGFSVKKILAFEVLSSTEWQIKDKASMFAPTEYNDISEFIDQKIKALRIYQDELKNYPHPRSIEGVKILAQYRGIEVGYKYAEAFQVIRILND